MVPARPFFIGSPGWCGRENDGVVGRIDVEADDLFELGRELGIIRQLEPADQMRPQAVSTPGSVRNAAATVHGGPRTLLIGRMALRWIARPQRSLLLSGSPR